MCCEETVTHFPPVDVLHVQHFGHWLLVLKCFINKLGLAIQHILSIVYKLLFSDSWWNRLFTSKMEIHALKGESKIDCLELVWFSATCPVRRQMKNSSFSGPQSLWMTERIYTPGKNCLTIEHVVSQSGPPFAYHIWFQNENACSMDDVIQCANCSSKVASV